MWVSSEVVHAVCSSFKDQYTACAQREELFILQAVKTESEKPWPT
jgi:hypothetical protein